MHTEVSELLITCSKDRNKRIAIAEPYGYQLNRLTCLAYTLWAICYQKETFIAIISVNHKQSEELLDSIKLELVSNKKLRADFPEAVGKNKLLWRRNELITRNEIKLVAAGMNQRNRLFRFNAKKPSLMIFDNIDDSFGIVIYEHKTEMYNKVMEAISRNSGNNTNVLATGNISDCRSPLYNLIIRQSDKNWIGKKYKAFDWTDNQRLWDRWGGIYKGSWEYYYRTGPDAAKRFYEDHKEAMLADTKVLWPEYEDYYSIMKYYNDVEYDIFRCEKLNDPYDPVMKRRAIMRQQLAELEAS
jgi:hypothetical protein